MTGNVDGAAHTPFNLTKITEPCMCFRSSRVESWAGRGWEGEGICACGLGATDVVVVTVV